MNKLINWKKTSPQLLLNKINKELPKIHIRLDKIIKTKDITFDNTITELELMQEALDNHISCLNVYGDCLSTKKLQPILKKVDSIKQNLSNKIFFNMEIYQRIAFLSTQKDNLKLTSYQSDLLTLWMNLFIEGGILLDKKSKDRIIHLEKEIDKLKRQFDRNLILEEKKTIKLTKKDLDGLNDNDLELFKKSGTDYLIKNDDSLCRTIIVYCTNPKTRELVWKFNNSKGLELNKPIAEALILKRQEISKLKGFKNHAEFTLSNGRMLGKVSDVKEMLLDLNSKLDVKVNKEIELIKQYAKKEKLTEVKESDYLRFIKQIQQDNSINNEQFKKYFTLESVKSGFFNVICSKMNLKFKKVKVPTWHPSVETYKVFYKNSFIGSIYFDLFQRADKISGAWCYTIQQKTKKSDKAIAVCMNLMEDDEKALSLDNVQTFFHEMGHAIHCLLSEDITPSFNCDTTEWDVIELPSQVMESLVLEDWILPHITVCPEGMKPISKNMISKIKRSNRLTNALEKRRSIGLAYLDISLYSNPLHKDLINLENDYLKDFTSFKRINKTCILPSLSHIFSYSYHAGYYSYLWSEQLDADIFSHWKKHNFSEEIFEHYVSTILMPGSNIKAKDKIFSFLGRETNNTAWLKRMGI